MATGLVAFSPPTTTISLDAGTTFQTMRGWEAQGHAAEHLANFTDFADGVFTMAADVGIDRVRLEVPSGLENTTDYWAAFVAAGKPASGPTKDALRAHGYEAINDDSDPNHIEPSGFQWSHLDDSVTQIVAPFKTKVEATGRALYINLCYVAFTNQITSGIYAHSDPAEYAEFILATFLHLQTTYGWVPNSVEVILEPDNSSIWAADSGTLIGQAIKAAGDKLAAAGFHPDFIAPSVTNMDNAVPYFTNLMAVSGVSTYVKEFSYHRYYGATTSNLDAIASAAVRAGINPSMLEWWSSGMSVDTLHEDLKRGRNGAWQQGALAVDGPSAFGITTVGSGSSTVTKNTITGYTQLYYRYIRRGATRIAATSGNGALDPLAFINTDGRYAVVVKASSSQSFSIGNLPPGTYGTRYTTASAVDVNPGDQVVGGSGTISTSIPAAGVLTVFATSSGVAAPGVFGKSSPSAGATGQPTSPTLSWGASSGATGYEYCLDTTNNGACDTAWISAGSNTSMSIAGLALNTIYSWQVRATNAGGTTTADGGTWWALATQALGSSIVQNGGFGTGLTGWETFATPDPSYLVATVTSGVLQFYLNPPPPGTSNQGVVLQHTWVPMATGVPVAASFDLGNSSTVRKRISVLIHDQDFSDLSVCTFWLPANAPLRTYRMVTHPTEAWTGATISFYAVTPGSNGGFYLLDNVSLASAPAEAAHQTTCVDPTTPAATGGADSAELLVNPSFSTGTTSGWTVFGTIVQQVAGGVFEFYRPAGEPAGGILQPTAQAMSTSALMTATFELGNSSSVRKRVTVLLHDLSFSDLSACTFWLEPGQPLAPYAMQMFAAAPWTNATLSIYPATTGTEQWMRFDNASFKRTPGVTISGTICYEPGAAPAASSGGAASVQDVPAGPTTGTTTTTTSTTMAAAQDRIAASNRAYPGSGLGWETRAYPGGGLGWETTASVTRVNVLGQAQPIDLRDASSARLIFQSWLSSRGSRATLQVSTDCANWETVLDVPALDDWITIEADLSPFAGQAIHVRFVFDAVASGDGMWAPDVWRIGDVRADVWLPVPPSARQEFSAAGATGPSTSLTLGWGARIPLW